MSVLEQLKEVIESNPVVLFMKGTPEFPQCGFSGRTAQILIGGCDIMTQLYESGELQKILKPEAAEA